MRILAAVVVIAAMCGAAFAGAPDISKVPPHPRLWLGGVKTAPGYIDPASLTERMKTHPAEFALLARAKGIDARALYAMTAEDKEAFAKVVGDLKTFTASDGGTLYPYALAYDWIATSLTESERKEIAKHLADVAIGPVGGSGGENPFDNNSLRRGMGLGLTALAVAGDDPRAQTILNDGYKVLEGFLELTGDGAKPDDMLGRGAYGGGWPEGHDYDRHGSRYAMIYFLGQRSATGVDVFSKSAFWKAKILYQIYNVLPNGRNILPYDDNDNPFLHRYDREVMLVLAREFGDPHARWYLNHVNKEAETYSASFEFLYNEPKTSEHDYSDLPKAHFVPGVGMVYARSGWGPNDTYVAFCASDWYVYHQNNNQNTFAIYRNAPLAVKDGVYDGGGSTQFWNYSIRTISYNGMTVFDPKEAFHGPDEAPDIENDGGEMVQQWTGDAPGVTPWRAQARRTDGPMRDIVDWKGFETNDTYTYCAAEAGRAYKSGKVPFFSRQMLFIYPNWIIVFDRVISGDASFTKQFHIHAPEELSVNGSEAVITTRTTNGTTIPGRLFVKSLLPAKAQMERIEGLAVYGGKSHDSPKPYNDQFYCPVHLEITAPPEKTSYFLTAMYACDATVREAPEAKVLEETAERVVVGIEGKWKASFNKTGEVGWEMVK
jgi:hypothetical protein